jgi:heme a synthase
VNALRRLSLVALVFATLHVIFGAIVRITGSGFGCGEHWPTCHGYWFPPMNRMDLVIEVTHRYLAAGLSAIIVALTILAFTRRRIPGVGGPGGVLRAASLASGLVVAAALFGAVIVRLELVNRIVVVIHLALAMSLLATLAAATVRAGGLGGSSSALPGATTKAARGATAAAIVAFLVLVMGALTANLAGAASACTGFPLCRNGYGVPMQHIQLTHRILAFLLLFHVIGLVIAMRKRGEPTIVRRAGVVALVAIVTQVLVAAALVETGMPLALRSAHQAVGTVAWVAVTALAILARTSARGSPAPATATQAPRFSTEPAPAVQ